MKAQFPPEKYLKRGQSIDYVVAYANLTILIPSQFTIMVCENNLGREEEELQTRQFLCKRYLSLEKQRRGEKHFRREPPSFLGCKRT